MMQRKQQSKKLKKVLNTLATGLNAIKRYKPIKRPDLQAKLNEFQKDNEEFLNFWNEFDVKAEKRFYLRKKISVICDKITDIKRKYNKKI